MATIASLNSQVCEQDSRNSANLSKDLSALIKDPRNNSTNSKSRRNLPPTAQLCSNPTNPRLCPITVVTTAETMAGKSSSPRGSPPPSKPTRIPHPLTTLNSYDYEPAEPAFDDEEPEFEPADPDDVENPDGSARTPGLNAENHDDPNTPFANGAGNEDNVVTVDASGAANSGSGGGGGKKNAVVGLREKKIAKEKRSTTPYMTKYERARVLGTRALQIRYVRF